MTPASLGRLLPRSLLGQMLLAVALALLVAQGISAVLQYRAAEQRREIGAANQLAFQLVADPRFDFRPFNSRLGDDNRRWRRLRVERTERNPLKAGEERESRREEMLRAILVEQGIDPAELMVTRRKVADDAYVMARFEDRDRWSDMPDWAEGDLVLAGLRRAGETQFTVARVPLSVGEPRRLGQLIAQTVLLYVILVGGLAILLRRITRPLAALTARVETFAQTRAVEGQLQPSGPEDMRRLIVAHNAMEGRIAAMLDEKDVMLGAIGHDLKTPLAALRVRIESVEDAAEREKMAATIEDITRSLDDILTLARVGRPSDPRERTDLGALVASVVEEYEDMGQPVTLEEGQRLAAPLRATWLRRGLRNLIENALRYGERARVSLQPDGGEAVVRIEDDGPGIPQGEIGAMLQPFARGETSRNRVTGGAGLGLTLARAIAEQHGGRLVLANRTGADGQIAGLVAELRLPRA
jgi:signal transduction histidine kinase